MLLGKWGSAESKAEYGRVIQRWEAAGRRLAEDVGGDITINELILAFMAHVGEYYRDGDGRPTHEAEFGFPLSLRPLRELYGSECAADFGPLKLKAVRERIVNSGVSRRTVNQRTWRIKKMFKWGVENELVPPSVYHGVQAVSGLQRGRTLARETEPVRPVSAETVEATLPFLPPTAAALVRLQLLTGARAGELVTLRACNLETSGDIWVYRPRQHKSAHHGMSREIHIGPKAQAVLKPWLKLGLQAFLFSPREAEEARQAERGRKRQTPRYPSHMRRNERKRRGAKRRRAPKDRYTTQSYGRAVARACDLAFPLPETLAKRSDETTAEWKSRLTPEQHVRVKAWRREHRWHPHQLRHLHATEVRRDYGLEGAQVALGHAHADVTQIYARCDASLAKRIAREIG
jgi:integrase